ncbi:MAG TPA: cytochrome c peroxidase, partial [Labilithrix sp.]|nr:cytochrome c peroxidase [Labilithrix sp.]
AAPVDAGPLSDGALPDSSTPDSSTPDSSAPDSPDPNDGFAPAEIAAMSTLSPLPSLPADPTNAFANNALAAVLGQRLFFDKALSGAIVVGDDGTNGGLGAVGETGKVACASCHSSKATDDNRSKPNNVSLGTNYGTRNALSIVNSSFYAWTNWGGRFDSQWSLPLAVVENAGIMNGNRLQVAHLLWDKYKADYNAIFPVPLDARLDPADANAADFPPAGRPGQPAWDNMAADDKAIAMRIYANFGKAIAAYMRLEVSRNAPFDKYVAGDKSALGADAKRGLKVFLGKGQCVQCHSGPNFADNQFSNIGVEQTGPRVPLTDFGRFQDVPALLASPFNTNSTYSDNVNTGKLTGLVAGDEAQRGRFRTKSLRGLTGAAPYMHSGQLATLEAVVDYYSAGGTSPGDAGVKDVRIKPLGLSAAEKSDLVAFLKTLDGDPVPAALLLDTSRP